MPAALAVSRNMDVWVRTFWDPAACENGGFPLVSLEHHQTPPQKKDTPISEFNLQREVGSSGLAQLLVRRVGIFNQRGAAV